MPGQASSQQTQSVSVPFLESCSLVASDLTLRKRFYNVLSALCLEMSNIQTHVGNVVYVRLKLSAEILFVRRFSNVRQASWQYPCPCEKAYTSGLLISKSILLK